MKSDEAFRKDLAKGIWVQHLVAKKLIEAGLTVQVPRVEYKPGEWAQKDIDIVVGHTLPSVLEVKSRRRMAFTDAASYDYPTVFVDAVYKWNEKEVKPAWYVVVNQANEAMVCIDGATKDDWAEHKTWDSVSKQTISVYEASRELLLDFEAMVERLSSDEELSPPWDRLQNK